MAAPRLSLSAAPFGRPSPSPGTPGSPSLASLPKVLRASPCRSLLAPIPGPHTHLPLPGPRREPAPSLPHSAPQPPGRHPLLGAPLRRSPLWNLVKGSPSSPKAGPDPASSPGPLPTRHPPAPGRTHRAPRNAGSRLPRAPWPPPPQPPPAETGGGACPGMARLRGGAGRGEGAGRGLGGGASRGRGAGPAREWQGCRAGWAGQGRGGGAAGGVTGLPEGAGAGAEARPRLLEDQEVCNPRPPLGLVLLRQSWREPEEGSQGRAGHGFPEPVGAACGSLEPAHHRLDSRIGRSSEALGRLPLALRAGAEARP